MYWLEVSVLTDGEGAEAVAEALRPFAHGNGIAMEQLGDETDPDPKAMETAVTVKIYIPGSDDTPQTRRRIEEILYHMGRLYPLPPPVFRELEEKDWANAWKDHYRPFRIGRRLWIQPSWIEMDDNVEGGEMRPDDLVLILDPGMAFGTGTHPTTQMCLQALEELVRPGMSLFDVGTGSAILAIAAAKLGASKLLGIDIDEAAVKTAVANAAQNGVENQIVFQKAILTDIAQKGWDIVAVNILAPVIISLFDNDNLIDYTAVGGKLILSGIVETQAADVEAAVARVGGKINEKLVMGDWVSYVVEK